MKFLVRYDTAQCCWALWLWGIRPNHSVLISHGTPMELSMIIAEVRRAPVDRLREAPDGKV